MDLTIIIPEYRQDRKRLFECLKSIDTQIGIEFSDIEVLVVMDGGDTIDPDFFRFEHYSPVWLNPGERLGCGWARQYALDRAHGKWVYFMDSDDTLYDETSLMYIFSRINNCGDKKMFNFLFYNEYTMKNDRQDMGRLYASIFLLSVIRDNDLRFLKLNLYEDIAFVSLYIYTVTWDKVAAAEARPIYVYKKNDKSVTKNMETEKPFHCDVECMLYLEYKIYQLNIDHDTFFLASAMRGYKEYKRIIAAGKQPWGNDKERYKKFLQRAKLVYIVTPKSQIDAMVKIFNGNPTAWELSRLMAGELVR
jgi:glycosyltransferase involved in cell wall biosynthesis